MSVLDKASLIQIPSGYKEDKLYSVKPTPTYGSELVTNGDFATDSDWTKGSGVTISSGSANFLNVANNQALIQNGILSASKLYSVTFTISNYTQGGIRVGVSTTNSTTISANGTHTVELVSGASFLNIYFYATSTTTLSIDNVSVKEVLIDGDFNFTRASSATRVNSDGLIEDVPWNIATDRKSVV